MVINPLRRRRSTVDAIVGDTTAVPSDCNGEQELSVSGSSGALPVQDEEDGIEGLDDGKMVRVCDKLIDVFLVDKPNPTDWRRLLAFSKEWSNLRPHFYKRCQDRADSEDDPGMKHKLLRLGRKLKEVSFAICRLTLLRVEIIS